ncbi:MAG TPA: ABC transporter permease [Candidatus Limnocylindrales bacterium]|nr:ABC transporter permease [Candidatus Limnocylindrales bacterium]
MAEALQSLPRPEPPAALAGIGRFWRRISPSLVPVLAVVTAIIATIPLMIITGGRGDIGAGLNIAGTAWSALIEGSLGLVINDVVSTDDFALLNQIAAADPEGVFDQSDLRRYSRAAADLVTVGPEMAAEYELLFAALPAGMDDATIDDLAGSIADLRAITPETLRAMQPLLADLAALPPADARELAAPFRGMDTLTADDRAALEAVAPSATNLDDAALLTQMQVVAEVGVTRLVRLNERLDVLDAAGIDLNGPEADALASIADLQGGAGKARLVAETRTQLEAQGVTDATGLQQQVEIVRRLYDEGLLTDPNVINAINTELPAALEDNLIIQRPGNRILVAPANDRLGIIWTTGGLTTTVSTEASASDEPRPFVVYLALGQSAGLFFPANLETMLVRATPFILAGLALVISFKTGLFNIGGEGQLYAGAIFAVAVAIMPELRELPTLIYLALVIAAGMLGGFLWGAIPGVLKAFTGASEVITTIMLNYIAILSVDWLIKSTNPRILLDPEATTPRTPFVNPNAVLPRFSEIPIWMFFAVGIVLAGWMIWRRRAVIAAHRGALIRPVITGLVVTLGGLFLWWSSVENRLHIGFVIMLIMIFVVDWFMSKSTLGFEFRTVGANTNAAKYSGMSVKRSIILAMALTGAIMGLTGAIEVTGVQYNMQPAFFAGLGFDAIAVALLARTNPKNMFWAGLLWGVLLSGAGLMQVRADISIDLVKIVQALVLIFIAADAIIRWLWRIPATDDGQAVTFTKGWG